MAGDWVRLDADYFSNPKVLAAGRDGAALHLASICWCAMHETDGRVPKVALPTIMSWAGVHRRAVDAAMAAGLWVANGDGFVVHDFDVMNGSQSQAHRQRQQWRERQRRSRESRKDHGVTDE